MAVRQPDRLGERLWRRRRPGAGVDDFGPAAQAPAITAQPVNQSVPMGLTATYSVTATGTAPQYQWSKNGVAIPGANASTYVTPATGFDDTGTSFTVTVTNSGRQRDEQRGDSDRHRTRPESRRPSIPTRRCGT